MVNTTLNFAILDIQQTITGTGYLICVTTNNPCHLYLHHTEIEPEKHKRAIFRRGLRLPDAIAYCFVAWEANEQLEPGDTLTHTFYKPDWPICQTRWFTFKGTVNGQPSPSVGPIFKKHRPRAEWGLFLTEPWTWYGVPPPAFDTNLITEHWSS